MVYLSSARIRAVFLLFFSGSAALVYQTIWVKQLSLVVGLDVYAVTTAVAAFFAGMALGSALIGRLADHIARPLALYAVLEVGVAVSGVGATLALACSDRAFVALQDSVGAFAWLLPFVIVGLPAFLLGGTLPALMRDVAPDDITVGRASGVLYGANTAGAVVGTLATTFVLVPLLGIKGAALVAGSVNIVLALVAIAACRKALPVDSGSRESLTSGARLGVALYALAGGVALGYEVVWTQVIVQFVSTRSFAFSIVLTTYLAGLVLGSSLYAPLADRIGRPWTAFGLLIGGAGASSAMSFAVLGPWLPMLQSVLGSMVVDLTENRLAMMCTRFAVASVVIVLPTTILLGAAFPAAIRLTSRAARVGRDVGVVAALNTAGGIAGTFLVGFYLIPFLGLAGTLGVLAATSVLIGGTAMTHGALRQIPQPAADTERKSGKSRAKKAITSGLATAFVTLLVAAVLFLSVRAQHDKLARLLARRHGGTLVFYEESPGGTVAILEDQASAGNFRRLYIQGVSNSGDSLPSQRYMRLQALLPLLIHNGEPRSALVIGHGTGITAGALLAYPELNRRVCAELLPAVVHASDMFEGNMSVARDSRVEIRVRDGRHLLLSNDERYDLITLEPPPPSASCVANLYSRDFYELASDRLKPNGLIAQWWPLATQNNEDSQSLVRSFLDAFPHACLWTTEMHETLLIGSKEPIRLNVERIESRFQTPEVEKALRSVGVLSLTELLATYVTDRDGLDRYAGDAAAVTDDRPRIEHAAWIRDGEFPRVLERIAELRSPLILIGSGPSLLDEAKLARQKLWTLYRAGHYAYSGQPEKSESMLLRLGPELHRNPYFRWFVTEAE